MSITYKLQITRASDIQAPYYHSVALKTGEFTMDKLAELTNNSTTMITANCYTMLKSMKENIIEAFLEG